MGSYEIDFLEVERAVRITTEGRQGPDDHAVWVREALSTAASRGCRKFLADHRRMELGFPFIDIYEWPRRLKEMGLAADMRVAVVFATDDPRAADYRFFEDASFNQGFPLMRVFSDYDQGLAWLARG